MANTKIDETTESRSPANPLSDPGNQSDLIDTQIATAVLKATIPALLILMALGIVAVWIGGAGHELRYIPTMILALSLLAIWGLVRAGRVSLAARAYIAALSVAVLSGMMLNGGVHALTFPALIPLLATVGWLFGAWTAVTFAAVSALTGGAFVWLAAQGWLHEPPPPNATMIWLCSAGYLLVTLVVTAIPSRMLRQALLDSEALVRELHESEQRFRSVLESLEKVAVQGYEPDGTITFWNRGSELIFGFPRSAAIGRNIIELLHGSETREAERRLMDEALATGNLPATGEVDVLDKDGQKVTIYASRVLAPRPGGPPEFFCFDVDISEVKRTEERLGIATHAARIGVWDWDIAKNVLVWDDSMYMLYNIRREDFGGAYDAWSHTIHPEDKARTEGEIQATLRGEREYVTEFRILWPDGSIRHIKADSRTFRSKDDKPLRMVGTNIDITELKRSEKEKARLESQLAQAQKMEAIGTLAGGIAHDFNNILSPIVGYVDLAKMKAKDDPELSDYCDRVSDATSRATDLVRQILSFSRKKEQKKTPLQVSMVVKEALKLLRSSIPTSIEIRQEFATQALILADQTQIHQIVINLCTNAYHAMEKTGGLLTVTLKETEIPNENDLTGDISPGRYVVLEVSDTGCGMDKETQAKIFEPYFTTKETGKGTGLGMAVVHGIVKDHQGMILVDSEPGKGSTFRVYLPLPEDLKHAAHTRQEDASPTKMHEHILFVDDEEPICNMAKAYLANFGYAVDVCNNGRDALFAIEQDPKAYDLLITDMTMPGINGDELAKKVLALRPDLPVILCTGYSSLIDREVAAAIGISVYVEKPLVMNDLICRVQEVLKKRFHHGGAALDTKQE